MEKCAMAVWPCALLDKALETVEWAMRRTYFTV